MRPTLEFNQSNRSTPVTADEGWGPSERALLGVYKRDVGL
jgi:hypothetical protein